MVAILLKIVCSAVDNVYNIDKSKYSTDSLTLRIVSYSRKSKQVFAILITFKNVTKRNYNIEEQN